MNEQNQLDPQAVNLAKAIRQTESGGNFQAKGKSGEYGAYQFTEPTWNSYSKKYGINAALKDATPEQQNEVAYKQVKEWKDKGYNVGQIASLWNSGKPDAYNDPTYKGTNSSGANFDVPAYAKSVATAYQTLKNGGQVQTDPANPSNVSAPQFPFTQQSQTTQNQEVAKSNENPGGIQGLIQGVASPFLSAISSVRQLGNVGDQAAYDKMQNEGADYGYFGKARPLGQVEGGIKTVGDFGSAVGDTLKKGAEIGLDTVSAGGLIKAVRGASALASPAVESAMQGFKMSMPEFQALSNAEKLNALTEAVKAGVSASDRMVLTKAIQEVTPLAEKELGLQPGLLRKVLVGGGKLAWNTTKAIAKTAGLGEILRGGQDIKGLLGIK